jgi:hypothetical protein
MSSEAIKCAMEGLRGIKGPTARFVYLLLAVHHNRETGQCNPSYDRLASLVGRGTDSIKRGVKDLVKSEMVVITKRGRGSGNSNHYRLTALSVDKGALMHHKPEEYEGVDAPINGVNGASAPSYGGVDAPRIIRKKKNKEKRAVQTPLPHGEQFATAWQEFSQHRRETRHCLTPTASKRILNELAAFSESVAVESLHEAIAKSWRKPFPKEARTGRLRL